MYRNLHNVMLAFSASGLVLLVGLMAGVPQAPTTAARTVSVGPLILRLESSSSLTAAARAHVIEARAKVLEAQIQHSASTADVITHAADFAGDVAMQSAFAVAFANEPTSRLSADQQAEKTQRRHLRRARAALALPYFSFAQGLRRNRS